LLEVSHYWFCDKRTTILKNIRKQFDASEYDAHENRFKFLLDGSVRFGQL